jgi:hypothetical protein
MARNEEKSLKRQNVRSIEGLTISSNEKEQLLDHIVTIHLFLARNGEAGLELVCMLSQDGEANRKKPCAA